MKLQASGWPDYVFGKEYRLIDLKSLEQFINQHGHLPEVPTAKEVEEQNLDLGNNQAILLKKIEELTLYVIELKKQNDEQDKVIRELKNKIEH